MEIVKLDIKTLYEQRKKYIEESNYLKADELSKKINNYKSFQIRKQERELAQKKEEEQNTFEKAYTQELIQFKEKWTKEEENIKKELNDKKEKLKERQKLELREYMNNINADIKQKISPNYLNLKKMEITLVKQERFLEAEQIKHQAEKLLKKENDLMEVEYQTTIRKKIYYFKKRQQDELNKLNEDNKKQIYLIQKYKNKEFDEIINKYRIYKIKNYYFIVYIRRLI